MANQFTHFDDPSLGMVRFVDPDGPGGRPPRCEVVILVGGRPLPTEDITQADLDAAFTGPQQTALRGAIRTLYRIAVAKQGGVPA